MTEKGQETQYYAKYRTEVEIPEEVAKNLDHYRARLEEELDMVLSTFKNEILADLEALSVAGEDN